MSAEPIVDVDRKALSAKISFVLIETCGGTRSSELTSEVNQKGPSARLQFEHLDLLDLRRFGTLVYKPSDS